jgi:hypothetical protein
VEAGMGWRGFGVLGRHVSAGMVAAIAGLAGCGSGSVSSTATTTVGNGGVVKNVYVVQQPTSGAVSGSILAFPATSNGTVSPTTTLTTTGMIVTSVFVDTKGQVYAGGTMISPILNTGVIEVFAAGASGTATPVRTITSNAGTFNSSFYIPTSMWVDSLGQLYVTGQNASLSVFTPTANGAATPYRFLQGATTQISSANGVAVDSLGNIYIANGTSTTGSILAFSSSATGNVAPEFVISGTNTVPLLGMTGISLDTAANIYVVNNTAAGAPSTVLVFAPGSSGVATPAKTIGGTATGLANGAGVSVDGVGNVYVLNETVSGGSVLVFGVTASGNVSPATQFISPSWTAPVAGEIGLF